MNWGDIHLQVCIFGLLKNCNDLGVYRLISCVAACKTRKLERVAFMQPVCGRAAVGADECNGPLSRCSSQRPSFLQKFHKIQHSITKFGLKHDF